MPVTAPDVGYFSDIDGVLDFDLVSDADLVRAAARSGGEKAFEELYARYAVYVCSILQHTFRLQDDATDLVQEIFLQLWLTAGRYDESRASVKAWIALVTRSRAIDFLRGRRTTIAGLELTADIPGLSPMDAFCVRQAVSQLPETHRSLVYLAFFEGWSHRQIATILAWPLGTVKSKLRASVNMLRTANSASVAA